MFFVGLTGGVGSGKSEVLRLLKALGAVVLSADEVGHRLLDSPDIRRKLVKRFGRGILTARGKIARSLLAQAAFSTKSGQTALNRLVHPPIRREISLWRRRMEARRCPPRLAVVEVPLLYEEGWSAFFDGVLAVWAPERVCTRRLAVRGWSAAEIRRRRLLQWPPERKNRRSDWVITNDGSRARLARSVGAWLRCLGPERRGPCPSCGK